MNDEHDVIETAAAGGPETGAAETPALEVAATVAAAPETAATDTAAAEAAAPEVAAPTLAFRVVEAHTDGPRLWRVGEVRTLSEGDAARLGGLVAPLGDE